MRTITIPVSTSGRNITVYGNMFNFQTANGLYLSSNNFNGTQRHFDFYSMSRSVSANNKPFSAYPVDVFKVLNNNTLEFQLSAFNEPQILDIIYANPAGYNLLSRAKRSTIIKIVSSFA